jgi:hypothetical protein
MTSPLSKRRQLLRDRYGFDFPDDLFRFWEFANRLRPLEPLSAFQDTLTITLVGAFEVLAGRFDGRRTRYSQLLHWRYYFDPPEFFTVLVGHTDGPHWGYFLDDPPAGPGCIAHYYADEPSEMTASGNNLFEALRLELETQYEDWVERALEGPEAKAISEERVRDLDGLRELLGRWAPGGPPETGAAYLLEPPRLAREERVAAQTHEGMGVVVPPELYRPLSMTDRLLWEYLLREDDPAAVVEEARQALRDGFPGTALKLGKELWSLGGEPATASACELLETAYTALGREVLRNVLQTHRANRDLPWVDILQCDAEVGGNGQGAAPPV